jgi:hypothetical protein
MILKVLVWSKIDSKNLTLVNPALSVLIFPRNTEILVFLGLSESCVYLVPFYAAVFPNLAVLYHQYSNYMPF